MLPAEDPGASPIEQPVTQAGAAGKVGCAGDRDSPLHSPSLESESLWWLQDPGETAKRTSAADLPLPCHARIMRAPPRAYGVGSARAGSTLVPPWRVLAQTRVLGNRAMRKVV